MLRVFGGYISLPIGNRRYGRLPVGATKVAKASIIPLALSFSWLMPFSSRAASVVFETTSPYHHIRVVDDKEIRILCFDDGHETRMSLRNPLFGHFEYTEYFHMAWLWNTNITSVLMLGLGGGSAQRSFEHYYPAVTIDTVEIDPSVVQVAHAYFGYEESERQKIHVEDGRLFLRRSNSRY